MIEQENVPVDEQITGGTVNATVETSKINVMTYGIVYLFVEVSDKESFITAALLTYLPIW